MAIDNSDICTCDHMDLYHMQDLGRCLFSGCACEAFQSSEHLDSPDEIIEEGPDKSRDKTKAVLGATAENWSQLDYGEYMCY